MGDGMGGDATCVDCHGADHGVITAAKGHVPASICAGCHPEQYAEFTVKDGHGAFVNKHALGWTRMTGGGRYRSCRRPSATTMCERCHNIGYVCADGSVGKCDSCHTRHVFSAAEATEPEACGTCHMGPDHEQIDMWEKSKHGVVYTTEKERAGGDPTARPTCVTCHMPVLGERRRSAADAQRLHQHHARHGGAGRPPGRHRAVRAHAHDHQDDFTTTRQDARRLRRSATRRASRGATSPAPTRSSSTSTRCCGTRSCASAACGTTACSIRCPRTGPPNPSTRRRQPNTVRVLGGQQLYGGTSAIEQMLLQHLQVRPREHVQGRLPHQPRLQPLVRLVRG